MTQKNDTKIGCLGEVMLELIPATGDAARLGIAGDTYNTAVYLARAKIAVDYITVLGHDGFSDRIRRHMTSYHVGTSRLVTHQTRIPGLYAIETDETGERSFTYWRGESAARCLGAPDLPAIPELLRGLTHVFYSGISLAILAQECRDKLFAALADFRAAGGIVAFDSNYRPRLWASPEEARREMERAWRHCDIGLPSVDDEMALNGDADDAAVLARFADYGVTQGALKRGADGPIGLDGTPFTGPAKDLHVVDSTAAGDSFNAAFLAALIGGKSTSDALSAGHTLAGQVIGQSGAIIFPPPDASA